MNLSLRLSESLAINLKEFAKKESISMNQFIATAIAEKMATLQTYDYLKEREKRGNLSHFKQILSKVKDNEPEEFDKFNS